MKQFLLLLALLLGAPLAQAINVTFAWDANPASEEIYAYRFYDVTGGGRVLLAWVAPTSTSITLTNYTGNQPRQFMVTSTNLLGESLPSNTVTVPKGPSAPASFRLSVSALTVPVPAVIELSRDLDTWRERIELEPAGVGWVNLSLVQYPTEPAWFMREAPPAP